jgi:hypothetical protein
MSSSTVYTNLGFCTKPESVREKKYANKIVLTCTVTHIRKWMSSELGIMTYTMNYNHLDKWLHSSSDWKLAKNGREQGNGHIHKDVPNGNNNKMYTTMPGTFRASKDLRITERADCGSIPGYNKTTNQN